RHGSRIQPQITFGLPLEFQISRIALQARDRAPIVSEGRRFVRDPDSAIPGCTNILSFNAE
ncbi:hypothetical protein DN508_38345, partial [Burkholderia multivorans]